MRQQQVERQAPRTRALLSLSQRADTTSRCVTAASDSINELSRTYMHMLACMQDPAEVAALGLTQGFREGCMRPPEGSGKDGMLAAGPVCGSAMEAWMQRAAARHLHRPWVEKRRDYIDVEAQMKRGYSEQEVMQQVRAVAPAKGLVCHGGHVFSDDLSYPLPRRQTTNLTRTALCWWSAAPTPQPT